MNEVDAQLYIDALIEQRNAAQNAAAAAMARSVAAQREVQALRQQLEALKQKPAGGS